MTATAAVGGDPARYREPEIELADRADIVSMQRERLTEIIGYALANSALTKELWAAHGLRAADVRTMEDFLDRAPFFVQNDSTDFGARTGDPFGGLLSMPRSQVEVVASTSGTTGIPMALPQYADNPRAVSSSRDLHEEGLRQGDTMLRMNIVSRGGLIQQSSRVTDPLEIRTVTMNNNPASAAAVIDAAQRFSPVSFHIMSRPLMIALNDCATERGIDLNEAFSSFRTVTFGGEPLGDAGRAQLKSWFSRVRVHTGLGNTVAAVECLEADGGHTWEDLVLIEVLDPETRLPVAEGEVGELVVTTLMEKAMPLLRFRTEDLVRFTSARCGCGRTHGRIWTVGRLGDGVRVAGKVVLPSDLLPILAQFPETQAGLCQLVQPKQEEKVLRIRVGRADGRSDTDLGAAMQQAVMARLGLESEPTFVANTTLLSSGPGYKISRIIKE